MLPFSLRRVIRLWPQKLNKIYAICKRYVYEMSAPALQITRSKDAIHGGRCDIASLQIRGKACLVREIGLVDVILYSIVGVVCLVGEKKNLRRSDGTKRADSKPARLHDTKGMMTFEE